MNRTTIRTAVAEEVASQRPILKIRQTALLCKEAQGSPILAPRNNRAFLNVIAFIAFVMLMVGSLNAQETRATLSGTVTDPSQATIVGASLQLTNLATGVTATATTNSNGEYRFLFVDPGNYKLVAEAAGFESYIQNGIVLNVSQASTVDIKMTVGSQSQTVTVTSEAPLLETEKSDRGVVLDLRSVEEIPLAVRNPIELVEAVPGVTQVTQRYDLLPFTNNGNSNYSFNGMNGDATENLLDGAPNDMIYQGLSSIAYIPSVDAVSEFKALTSPFDAQYGRNSGGVISVVTKSGTNTFHGTAYDFINRTPLFANSWANDAKGQVKSNQSLDEYGYTIGGPVRVPHLYNGKDKTFFFNGWEGYDQNINLVSGTSVPTALQRAGDFSQTFDSNGNLIKIYDPSTGKNVNGVWTRTQFPGNVIPPGQIDKVGQALANAYPLPNTNQTATVNWQNNYLGANVTTYSFHNLIARVDHEFSEREKVYVRYAWNKAYIHQNSNNLASIGMDDRFGTKTNNDVVADSVTVLTPNTVFDLRASLTRWTQNFLPQAWGSFNDTQLGFPAATVAQFQEPQRFPYVTAANYQYLGESSGNIWFAPTTAFTVAPTLNLIKGRQSIKFGLDYRWTRYASFTGFAAGGQFVIDTRFTGSNYATANSTSGNSIASMLIGGAYSGEVDTLAKPFYNWMYYAPWVQDDLKLTSRLTINAGLRYDIQTPVTERHNLMNRGFNVTATNPLSATMNHANYPGNVFGGLGFVGVGGNSNSPFDIELSNFQPRIGAAYRLRNDLVLRGGWGLFFIPQYSVATSNGFSQATPYVGTLDSQETIANPLSNPFPTGIIAQSGSSLGLATQNGGAPSFSDPSGKIGHLQVFNFGFQKQLPGKMTLDASYAGSRASQIPVQGLNIDALSSANLALGNTALGGTATNLTKQVANPFQGQLPSTSLNSATISAQQSLLPFPQFTSVTENDVPVGHYWYNSLQVNLQQRTWHNLDSTISYTFSKDIEAITYLNPQDAFVNEASSMTGPPTASQYADSALASPTHSVTPYDRTQRLDIAPVYELPLGRGKAFFSNSNRVVNLLISGWQGAGHIIWQTGAPMTAPPTSTITVGSIPTVLALVGNPNVPHKSWGQMFNSGTIQLDGSVTTPVAGLAPAWKVMPQFAQRTLPLYLSNVRDRWGTETNLTATKNNYFRETMNLQLRFEFLNAFNHPIFGGDPNITYSSPQFGQLIRSNGQSNVARTIQLAARFVF
jgi:hypothetical protein